MGNLWKTIRGLFIAWLAVNLALVAVIALLIRLTHFDTAPGRVSLAQLLTQDRIINLQEVAPGVQTIRHVFRLDTDGDGFEEWVVFYRYDATTEDKGAYRPGPYGAAVYDVDRCRPPAIVTYELRPYDYDYVADGLSIWWEGGPQMLDVNGDQKEELVIHIGNDLSVFRWFDRTGNCTVPGPGQQGYELLGTFRGSGGVWSAGGGRVAVVDRGFFDRSQIAVKRLYGPDKGGSYLQPAGGGLYPPQEETLDFAFGQPVTVTQLYYPEKAVLAFYLNLGQDNKAAEAYLSQEARTRYPIKTHDFGLALPRTEVTRVLVKEIRYTPNIEAERLHQPQLVAVTVVGVRADGTADAANPRRVVWKVVGVPKQGARPYNCEWRLHEIVSTAVP